LLVCCYSAMAAVAQPFTGKGSVITLNNDTLYGQIEYNNRSPDNKILFFKDEYTKEKMQLSPDLCKAFKLASTNQTFEKWTVKKYLNFQNPLTLEIEFADSIITETGFLRLLYKGQKVSLYHQFHHRDHYFIYDPATGIMENLVIVYQPYRAKSVAEDGYRNASIKVKMYFRNQLLQFIDPVKDLKIRNLIDKCNYRDKDLLTVIKLINGESKSNKKINRK
jgi:hypothetical protein